ncbi:hypothetical protein A0O28_0112320 [Trichoderma guizhouense]|uniref:C2H2-type domain-containing protein n=1 Tax=Trichoderma guizhouense TaxID=1491466 RepID=A0A1T3C4M6_9HYPO|nr:hypothetical protein A0O28_0112320 [Trichoderma guizhouense]
MDSIANATSECREAFQKYLKEPYPGTESDVARLFINFERWSTSLSVDRNWPSPTLRRTLSLDTLLSTDAMTKRKLTDLLLLIAKHIRQASEASVQSRTSRASTKSKGGSHSGYSDRFSESTFESFNTFVTQTGYINPLKAMKLYMKRLYDFSTLLRATVPEIRYLAPHHEKDESFWQVASAMVDYKFPDADPEIASRLAAAMILRRGRLMQLLTRRGPEKLAHANTGSETKKGEEPEQAGLSMSRAPTSAATVMSAGSNARNLSKVTASIVSNHVKALEYRELIPSRPKISETGGFTCRYCHRTLQRMSASRLRRHVLQDIEPFVCLHVALSADSVINMDQEDGDVASESISFLAWDNYQISLLDDEDSDPLFDDPVNADNRDQDAVMGPWPNVEDEWGFIKASYRIAP